MIDRMALMLVVFLTALPSAPPRSGGIDAGTVRQLIEHLATIARNSPDGLGPISPDQITAAFTDVCGYPPDDRVLPVSVRKGEPDQLAAEAGVSPANEGT
jgi:hypothetical protein